MIKMDKLSFVIDPAPALQAEGRDSCFGKECKRTETALERD